MPECSTQTDLSFLDSTPANDFDKTIRRPICSDLIVKANKFSWSRESLSDEIEEEYGGFNTLGLKSEEELEEYLNIAVGRFRHVVESMSQIPLEFFDIPQSILYDVFRHTLRTAHRKQPSMSLLAAMALVSTVIGRKIISSFGTTSNIYVACIAPSAAGKDHPRKVNEKICDNAGLEEYLGPDDVTSGTAIIKEVAGPVPNALFHFDEFNKMILSITGKNASSALSEIISVLLRLYTSTTNPNYRFKGYADAKLDSSIHKPHVSIYATGTPEFTDFVPTDLLADGFFSRLILFDCGDKRPPHQEPADLLIPQKVIDWFSTWGMYRPPQEGNRSWDQLCFERVVKVSDDAHSSYLEFQKRCDILSNKLSEKEGSSIWARTAEKASKFALIYSASECLPNEDFEIECRHMDWAIGLTSFLTVQMMQIVESKIGKTQREKDAQQILDYVAESKNTGRSLSETSRKFRKLESRYRKDLIEDLAVSRDLYVTEKPTKRRPKQILFCREFLSQMEIAHLEGEVE